LNDIDIISCDLKSACLNAPCWEKIWFEGGIECGEDQGKVRVVVHSLYELKSAGAAFWSSLAQILRDVGYDSRTKADPDVWIRKNSHQYYEMLFVNVNNILALPTKLKMQLKKSPPFTRLRTEVLSNRTSIWAPISHACNYLTVEKYGQLRQRRMWRTQLSWLNNY
jgi:hypothetical protein